MYHTGTAEAIRNHIFSQKEGTIFATSDFEGKAPITTIREALHRLTKAGILIRVLPGIYCYDPNDTYKNGRDPFPFEVAEALARNNHWRIVPKATEAKFLLDFSRYFPSEHIYYSTGITRTYTYGSVTLKFIHTTRSYVYNMHRLSAMIVAMLSNAESEDEIDSIITYLRTHANDADRAILMYDRQFATARMKGLFDKICAPYD